MKRITLVLIVLLLAVTLVPAQESRLRLATTTSTENSGLLAVLHPVFEAKSGLKVDVIAVGTGKALKLGENGDVDLVLVHARAAEDEFVAAGFGINRRDVMHNDFVILGPAADPAGVKGLNAGAALAKIASARVSFVSRGDDSGTHKKERELWSRTGLEPAGAWYKEAGQGMGAVITMAENLAGYTLADRGTYLAMADKISLRVLVEGDPRLFNPYGVIAVNPLLQPHVNYRGAMQYIDWITSAEGQSLIAGYQKNGQVLFYPDALK
jgi:tungstate transport system substrate-binding protein